MLLIIFLNLLAILMNCLQLSRPFIVTKSTMRRYSVYWKSTSIPASKGQEGKGWTCGVFIACSPRKVVYFPSCINRSKGLSKYDNKEMQLTDKMLQLLRKAGYDVIFAGNLNQLCCGMAFSSKGYKEAGMKKSKEPEAALWEPVIRVNIRFCVT